MSQRTLLFIALGLMAGGLILGTVGLLAGGATPMVEQQQGSQNRQGEHGPANGPGGGFLPRRPGAGRGEDPGEGIPKQIPGPVPAPSPKPSPSPTG
jgi:hypothetical protein